MEKIKAFQPGQWTYLTVSEVSSVINSFCIFVC